MADTQYVSETKALAAPYQPTLPEQAVLATHYARRKGRAPAPRLALVEHEGVEHIAVDHPQEGLGTILLMEALGTLDPDFLDGLLQQLGGVALPGGRSTGLNFMLAMVKGIKPRDEIESALAGQMAVVHHGTMAFARLMTPGHTMDELGAAATSFAKLARTFTAQVEALKRYRCGEQKVTVERVTVNDGGQAIVGHVDMAGRENPRTTPWTVTAAEPDPAQPAEAQTPARLDRPRTTPWTVAAPGKPGDADAACRAEIPRTTPWTVPAAGTGAEADARRGPENFRTTPWTVAPAAAGRRKPGAYARNLTQNVGATP
jgi:hypothetical protein